MSRVWMWQAKAMQCKPRASVLVGICFAIGCAREPRGAAKPNPPADPTPSYSAEHIVPSGSLKSAPLAPGRLATIYGAHLGTAQPCSGTPGPAARTTPSPLRPNQAVIETQVFPTRLCETEVHVGGVAAGLMYVAAGQINFQVPQSTPTNGSTKVQVLHRARPGPAVSVPLTSDALDQAPGEVADSMFSALQRVSWERRYRPQAVGCTAVPAAPTAIRGGPNGYAYHCAASNSGVTAESLYYPVNPAEPAVLLLRADIRPLSTYPEWSAAVEQHLTRRLTQEFGPGAIPPLIVELGAYGPKPGLSWRTGKLTVFLHSNHGHLVPSGVRTGVTLIAVRDEILAQRPAALSNAASFPHASELELMLPRRYFAAVPRQQSRLESSRDAEDHRTRKALLGLLRNPPGEPAERAAALVAADDLAVRLGSLLVTRNYQNGSENLRLAASAGTIRAQLVKLGVRYGEIGHYSGDLEYDHSLLQRAWTEHPDTIWGQRAFLMLQRLGCATRQFACDGPNCFLSVIEQGEKFLERYPSSPLRAEQMYNLALAQDTWWSLGQAQPGDLSAQGAKVTSARAEQARLHAIHWYEELLRLAPGTPGASAAEIALPRLKLKLDTGERTFFCFSC